MNSHKFVPEGWNNEVTELNLDTAKEYMLNGKILQGLVKECDKDYNLYIKFENGLTGIIPRKEIEAINLDNNGLPKSNLCIGKVHKFVQFKVKEVNDSDTIMLSRKQVQNEALNWVKSDLEEGQLVPRNSKEHKTIWCICRNWRRNSRPSTYRRFISIKNKNSI